MKLIFLDNAVPEIASTPECYDDVTKNNLIMTMINAAHIFSKNYLAKASICISIII